MLFFFCKNFFKKRRLQHEEKTLAVFLVFTVLVALLAPTNANAYTKLGRVMTKASAKNFKIYINGSA
ncbi:TPA: hypothetical protein H1515_002602, partial [Listeria monocytogenes]|nr:hypothetical protein [Listeria monocytogenes]